MTILHSFAVVKKELAEPLQSFNRQCSGQKWNAVVKLAAVTLQGLNKHCSSQSRHDNPPQVFNYLGGSQNELGKHLQAFKMLLWQLITL